MAEEDNLRNINVFGENLSVKQEMFDVAHPIGEIYIQLPKQEDPMTLYNKNGVTSTWSYDTSAAGVGADYGGAFFRTEGGSACTFNKNALNLQNSQNLKHCHSGYTGCLNNACTTGGMSANATGCIWSEDAGTGAQFLSDADTIKCSGSLSIGDWGCPYNISNGGTKMCTPRSISINVSHTHNFNHRHSIDSDGGNEARPNNYTVRIWKRIA